MTNKLIIISGPTATGKTSTSIETAKNIYSKLNKKAVIVNFDSLLFYKEISIGSAKPTMEERQGIEHFMIDIQSIKSPMNVAGFIEIGEKIIKEQLAKGFCVILVGGSAFYLRALLKGMYESLLPSETIKNEIEAIYDKDGIDPIIDFLKINDPESLVNLHRNDHYRLQRAAIYFKVTGSKISSQKNTLDQLSPYDFSQIIHPWEILHIYLDLPKDEHYKIIQNRTEKMFESGLLDEINQLESEGYTLDEKPLKSIGYKEIIEWKRSQFPPKEECIERVAISTRQLAKSQRTFFKKITPKLCFNPISDQDKIFHAVELFLS